MALCREEKSLAEMIFLGLCHLGVEPISPSHIHFASVFLGLSQLESEPIQPTHVLNCDGGCWGAKVSLQCWGRA